jgi:hypothetical protein
MTTTPDNGLLTTIEQAAHSDDDLSPPPLPSKDDQRKTSAPAVMQSPLSITRYVDQIAPFYCVKLPK